ncbi:MAG: NADH-quinone oxidoreductase subunit J [bacterium]|nr:NADH-quinone oxidoreductase subunit J [bacterium]
MIEAIAFYTLSTVVLFFALQVVSSALIMRSVTSLICTLLAVAGLYLLLSAELAAAVQVLIYVGGIVVLAVFAVLLTSRIGAMQPHLSPVGKLAGALASTSILIITLSLISIAPFTDSINRLTVDTGLHSARDAGLALLSPAKGGYLVPFEMISLLLVAALIGATAVARFASHSTESEQSEGGHQ